MHDDDQHHLFEKDVPLMDAPAFVRRAREVEQAWTDLLEHCARERARLLEMPRMRLARLFALAHTHVPLIAVLSSPAEVEDLSRLHREWQSRLRSNVLPASSLSELVRAADDLRQSFERFNRRWMKKLNEIDLTRINSLRAGYNRFYLLEKECALRSARIARDGFKVLEPATVRDLMEAFPLLPSVRPRE